MLMGLVLFVVIVICSVFIFKSFLDSFIRGVSDETSTWGEASNKLDEGSAESSLIMGLVVSEVITQGLVAKTALFLFGIGVFIAAILSIMLVLQGWANQAK